MYNVDLYTRQPSQVLMVHWFQQAELLKFIGGIQDYENPCGS
jgi:hypothetical protein